MTGRMAAKPRSPTYCCVRPPQVSRSRKAHRRTQNILSSPAHECRCALSFAPESRCGEPLGCSAHLQPSFNPEAGLRCHGALEDASRLLVIDGFHSFAKARELRKMQLTTAAFAVGVDP